MKKVHHHTQLYWMPPVVNILHLETHFLLLFHFFPANKLGLKRVCALWTVKKLLKTGMQPQIFSETLCSCPVNCISHTGSLKEICSKSARYENWIIYWVVFLDFYSSLINHTFYYQRVFNRCHSSPYNKEDHQISWIICAWDKFTKQWKWSEMKVEA